MKSDLEKISNLERKLNVEIPVTEVQATLERMYKGIQKQANIKGFRPGKAPLEKIRSMYEDRVKADAMQELVSKHYSLALDEHDIDPISYPRFEIDQALNSNEHFKFSALFDVRPEVTVTKYEGLEFEKEKLEVDEEEVNKIIENIRQNQASSSPVLEARPAQEGDIAVIDFEGRVDGELLEGAQSQGHKLKLGSNQFIEGFEDGVLGMKIDETKTLNLQFPEDYHAKDIAGKPIEFKVTLKSLEKEDLPELDDEFAKVLGAESFEDIKANIRDDIKARAEQRIEADYKNNVLKKLVENNPVDVPPSMLAEQKNALMEDFKKRMSQQGMNEADFEEYKKKWDDDFENTAAQMIQASFIVDALAKEHKLAATEADVDKKLQEYADQTGIDFARVKEFYGKPEQLSRIRYQITEEKVIDFVASKGTVTEVEPKKD